MKTNLFINIVKTIFGTTKKVEPTFKPIFSNNIKCSVCKRYVKASDPEVIHVGTVYTHKKCLK